MTTSTTLHGLTNSEVLTLQQRFGFNVLPEKKPPTQWEIVIEQLKSPLVYILIVAAVVTIFLWDYEDTFIIWFSVVLNTILGWYQESKASKALLALKELLQPTISTLRDGIISNIATKELVPGDIILCKSGCKIPADGVIKENIKLTVSEAMLTWESLPVEKQVGDTVFMGTVVLSWSAYVEVTTIGASTELGKIATSLQWEETITPLQKQLQYFSKQLTWVVVAIVIIVFLVGLITGQSPVDIFTTAVALAVSAIPEGLLVALTVVLTIGMQRILKRKWLVKNLVSAETLGGVTVICSDKTGTLTQGIMEVVDSIGDKDTLAMHILRTNDDSNAVAKAIMERATKNIWLPNTTSSLLDTLPFSSEYKYAASLLDDGWTHTIYVTWAPEYLLQWADLDENEKINIKQQIDTHTNDGYRLVACAKKQISSDVTKIQHELVSSHLTWEGIICLADPIRDDIKDALEKTKDAGIKLIVITWDYPGTARAIMHKLWVDVDESMVMTGDQLAAMSDEELDKWLELDWRVRLFARTKPEQKLRIVQALKDDGEVVAMMGDGINDAPALKRADIGIVVAEATDVAKESADLILLDSSFSTIVAAIEEGRWMFDNIRKIILYLLCDAFEEIITIILCLLTLTPLPVTASQILWINLISDGFPNLALTVDPKRKWLMNMRPRSPKENIVNPWMKRLIVIVSLVGAAMCFLIFTWVLHLTNDIVLARSVSFVTLWINSLVYVFSVKTLDKQLREEPLFANKWLLIAVFFGLLFQFGPFMIPTLGNFLNLVRIGERVWAPIGAAFAMTMVIELYKRATIKRYAQ